jgi:replicative DNA helicase
VADAFDGDRVRHPQPFNPEAKQRLLGAILIDNHVYHRVAQLLRTDDFGNALHRRGLAAVGKLITEGREANPILLTDPGERAAVGESGRRRLQLLLIAQIHCCMCGTPGVEIRN